MRLQTEQEMQARKEDWIRVITERFNLSESYAKAKDLASYITERTRDASEVEAEIDRLEGFIADEQNAHASTCNALTRAQAKLDMYDVIY